MAGEWERKQRYTEGDTAVEGKWNTKEKEK